MSAVHDYTSLSSLDCPRYYYYAYRQHWRGRELNVPLHAGKAGHSALEAAARAHEPEAAFPALKEAWQGVMVPPTHHYKYLTLGHMEVVLRNLFASKRMSHMIEMPTTTVEGVVLGEIGGVPIGGKIDLLYSHGQRHTYIVDHKFTTSSITEWWASQFLLTPQFPIYQLLLEQKGTPVQGTYVHAVHMGPYGADPQEKWVKRQSRSSTFLGPYAYGSTRLAEVVQWVRGRVEEIEWRTGREGSHGLEAWPMRGKTKECASCPFKTVCASVPNHRNMVLQKDFVQIEPRGQLLSGADVA